MKCKICGKDSVEIAEVLGFCISCLRTKPEKALNLALHAHARSRSEYNLPPQIPCSKNGLECNLCANECKLGEGEKSYCGLRENKNGKIVTRVNSTTALLSFYLDAQPTNCCAAWFCEGAKERGKYNLAVFFYGCNFDCLFCQNISHKRIEYAEICTSEELVSEALKEKINCICYFGGSPEPQLPFALHVSERILEEVRGGKEQKRICWEWNGGGDKRLVRKAAELSLLSGGNIKFDLKAFDETLSIALSGVSNKRVKENFKMIGEEFWEVGMSRNKTPILTATTLLVPGYVDEEEVEKIAKFIASVNPKIPYSLLVFHPDYKMKDLPITPISQVERCYRAAKKYLEMVNIGNKHLLF